MKEIFETNQLVAVYGTLKRGFGNNRLLTEATFIGEGNTKAKYRLCINGLPYLIKGEHSDGEHVEIELYNCNPFEMYSLDLLESHPRFYRRELTDVVVDNQVYNAWIYFVPDSNYYNNGEYHKSYEGARYEYAISK